MPELITYQTRLSVNFDIRGVSVGQIGSRFPFDGQHEKSAKKLAENLRALCLNCLEPIRLKYIDDGFILNSVIRPAGNPYSIDGKISQHEYGQAADISFSGIRGQSDDRSQFYTIARWIRDNILFDQLILEYRSGGSVWIHISYNMDGNRRKVLTVNDDKILMEGLALVA